MPMRDSRLTELINLLEPAKGTRPWHGGATVLGCLRGVDSNAAAWVPAPGRHSIWALTLHVAYWKYAVRRKLEPVPQGSFPRSPSNWPTVPEATASAWKKDRALLKAEHQELVRVVREFEPARLDEQVPGSRTYRFADLLFGIAGHDLYHVGQIQLVKRLYEEGGRRG